MDSTTTTISPSRAAVARLLILAGSAVVFFGVWLVVVTTSSGLPGTFIFVSLAAAVVLTAIVTALRWRQKGELVDTHDVRDDVAHESASI